MKRWVSPFAPNLDVRHFPVLRSSRRGAHRHSAQVSWPATGVSLPHNRGEGHQRVSAAERPSSHPAVNLHRELLGEPLDVRDRGEFRLYQPEFLVGLGEKHPVPLRGSASSPTRTDRNPSCPASRRTFWASRFRRATSAFVEARMRLSRGLTSPTCFQHATSRRSVSSRVGGRGAGHARRRLLGPWPSRRGPSVEWHPWPRPPAGGQFPWRGFLVVRELAR